MKTYILFLLLIYTISISAKQPLDTIYANDKKNVALFFPNPIRQAITGASNFVFTYNREKEQYFGLVQAKPGAVSNLLVVTTDGNVYAYILKYSEQLPELNYFIGRNESIGNERPRINEPETICSPQDAYVNRKSHFQKMSDYLLKTDSQALATKRKKGIKVQLRKMVYDASEVYLVLEIKNKSGIDFEVDHLNVYRTNGNKKRKASYQRLPSEVIHKYKLPGTIVDGQSKRFVYVLPKFVLGDNEKLMLELRELKGSRKVILETIL